MTSGMTPSLLLLWSPRSASLSAFCTSKRCFQIHHKQTHRPRRWVCLSKVVPENLVFLLQYVFPLSFFPGLLLVCWIVFAAGWNALILSRAAQQKRKGRSSLPAGTDLAFFKVLDRSRYLHRKTRSVLRESALRFDIKSP